MHIKMAKRIFLCASVILWAANDQSAHAQMGPSQQGETRQQRAYYFPLIEGPGKIQIVNGGGVLHNVRFSFSTLTEHSNEGK